ncbi:hypothetical protein [Streptomyces sp. NPDC001340]
MTRTLLHIDGDACAHHDGDSEEAYRRTIAALTGLPGDYRTGVAVTQNRSVAPSREPRRIRGEST